MEYSGYGANDTLNGTFGNRRPDAYNYLSYEIWELKPISNREAGPARNAALQQIADYVELANRDPNDASEGNLCSSSGQWHPGGRTALFDQGQLLGYVKFFGIVWEINLYYDDPENDDSGLVFYRADMIENPVAEIAEEILRALAETPWVLLPPGRGPVPRPVPIR